MIRLTLGLLAVVGLMTIARGATVRVPGLGDVPEECTHHVPRGSHIFDEADGIVVLHPDGKRERREPCGVDYLDVVARQDERGRVYGDGWQAWTTYEIEQSTSSVSSADATFTQMNCYFNVPAVPAANREQTLFAFEGVQNINWVPPNKPYPPKNGFDIIQPVLQWGSSAAGETRDSWSIASWYVTLSNDVLFTDLVKISPGDILWNTMNKTDDDTWYINVVDQNTGGETPLTVSRPLLETQPWAYITLEVYGVYSCADYPPSNSPMNFTEIALWADGVPVEPQWQINAVDQPICNERAVSSSPENVTIYF